MKVEFYINQIEEILEIYESIISNDEYSDAEGGPFEDMTMAYTKSLTTIKRITGANSEYYVQANNYLRSEIHDGVKLKSIIGTIKALKSDLQNDYLKTLENIIQSEVFSGYLEMAEHILEEGYKDPAAVLIGSTLEVHLRELCISNGIDIEIKNSKDKIVPKKADSMNVELMKNDIYSKSYQKQIVAWFGLRNSAAHGKYTEYTIGEIKLMLQGVKQFILQTK